MATISGIVDFDVNRSATIDAGDSGIAGIPVVLQDTTSGKKLVVLTDANGNYSFTNVPDGNYRIVEAYGASGGVATPGDFTTLGTVGTVPIGVNPPLSTVTSPPVGATNLDSVTPDTLFVTVAGANLTGQNFLNGPVTYSPITTILDACATVSTTNLITSADNGIFGTFPDGTPAMTSVSNTVPYPGVTPDYTYVVQTVPNDGRPGDGQYTVQNILNANQQNGFTWWRIADHTSGNETGAFMLINGQTPGTIFFQETVTVTADTNYLFSSWIINLAKIDQLANPQLGVEILDQNGNPIYSANLGQSIPLNMTVPQWQQVGTVINSGSNTQLTVRFLNQGPGGIGNDYAIDDIALNPISIPNFTPVKSVSPTIGSVGTTVTYTVTIKDTCTSSLTGLVFQDTLPSGLTFVPNSVVVNGGAQTTYNPETGFTLPDIGGGQVATITFQVNVVSVPIINPALNTSTVSYQYTPVQGGIPNSFVQTSNIAELPIGAVADLSIVKTESPSPAVAGQSITYTLAISNAGPADATSVVVADTLPTGISGAQYNVNGGAFTGWTGSTSIGTVPVGTTATIQIVGTVGASITGNLINTGTVTSPVLDSNPANNTSTITIPVTASANISIVKSGTPSPAVAGQSITYTLVVNNAGPSNAQGVVVSDTLPTGIIGAQYSLNGGAFTGWSGSIAIGTLPVGTPATIQIVGTVGSSITGNLVNIGTVTSPTPDPTPANNTSTSTIPVNASADISIVKSGTPNPVGAGQSITYTLAVNNVGPSDALSVVVTDTLPSGISGAQYSVNGGAFTAWSGSIVIGTLPAGTPATIQIVGTVGVTITNLVNTGTVTSPTPDPTPSNNTSTATIPVNVSADLSIVKSGIPSPVVAGQSITYTLAVSNAGPSDAQGVVVSDTLPTGITGAQYSVNGGVFTAWSGSIAIGTLPVGTPATIQIVGTVSSSTTGNLVNTGTITSPAIDTNPANNTSTSTIPVNTSADISIVKTASQDPVFAGQSIMYTLAVSNLGPSDASSVVVSDTLPTGITGAQYSVNGGAFTAWSGSASIGTVPVGTPVTIQIVGTVSSGTTSALSNTATVTSPTPDSVPGNNTSTIRTAVTVSADISVIKTGAPNPAIAGQTITYTLAVNNAGPSDAQGVVVTDTLPTGISAAQYSVNGGAFTAWSGSLVIGTLPAGTPATIQIVGTVGVTITNLVNTGTVTSPTPDPTPSNNTSTSTIPVNVIADISIVKSGSPTPVVAGQSITYTLAVNNAGPSNAQGVVVTDTLPTGITGAQYSVNGGAFTAWSGSVAIGTVPISTPSTIQIVGTVASNLMGNLVNTAVVTSPSQDPVPSNNTSTSTIPVTTSADVSIVKSVTPNPVVAGQSVTYTLAVSNAGPSVAQNVVVADTLPIGILGEQYSINGGAFAPWSGSINIGAVPVGTPTTIQIVGTLASSATGTLANIAAVTSPTPDPVPNNNTSTNTVPITTSAALSIIKVGSPNPVMAGSTITYTLTLTNAGPSDAQAVTLTDALPAIVQNPQYSLDGGMTWASWSGSIMIGTVAAGTVETILIRGIVASTATGNLINTAVVSSPTPNPNPSGGTSTTRNLVNKVDVIKTSSAIGAIVGDTITYTITVMNKGEVTAEVVVVKDVLVPQLAYAGNLKLNGAPISGDVTVGVNIGNVLPGQTATITFDAKVLAVPVGKIIANGATANYIYRANPSAPPIQGTSTSPISNVTIYSPSLGVTKVANKQTILVGQPFVYTITATNTGDMVLNNVIVTDTLPPSFIVQSMTLNGVPLSGNLGSGINIGSLAIGTSDVITVTIIINDTVNISSFKNNALITGGAIVDPTQPPKTITGIGTDTKGINIYNPKLAITKSADKGDTIIGDIVSYTIKVKNEGNIMLNNVNFNSVTLFDILPSELEFITGSVIINGVPSPQANILSGINLGTLAINQTDIVTFEVKVISADVTPIMNTAIGEFTYQLPGETITHAGEATSNTYELNVYKANLEVVKSASKASASLGDRITYTVTVTNKGNVIAHDVRFSDQLPPQLQLVPGSFRVGTQVVNGVNLANGVIIPCLEPGQMKAITYKVRVIGGVCNGLIINQAQVTFAYILPDGTGGSVTETGASSAATVQLTLTTFKQTSIESYLAIPLVKPDIEAINSATGTIDITGCHVIATPQTMSTEGQKLTGYKLIVRGNLSIVIEYTALDTEQSVHSAHYTIPFSTFIVLPENYSVGSKLDVSGMVEDIYYKAVDIRNFFTNTTALINVKIVNC